LLTERQEKYHQQDQQQRAELIRVRSQSPYKDRL